jgi:hypothetical protein
MRLRLPCVLAALLATSSAASAAESATPPPPGKAAAPAPPPAQLAPDQEALRKLFEREAAPLSVTAFETKSHVRGKVEAKGAVAIAEREDGDSLTIAIGTTQPLGCGIIASRVDAGGTIWNVLEKARATGVELLQVLPVEVAHTAGNALLFFEVYYRTRAEKPLLGQLKVAVAPHTTHSLVCTHDEPGYGATFRRIVKGLAASLASDAEDVRATATFTEQSKASIGELPVGYEERVLRPREGGGRTSVTYSALFLPRTPAELATLDTISIEVSDADGLLLERTFVEAQNGQVESQLKVTRGEDRRTFTYEGTKSGKKLSGSFQSKAGLATEFWFAKRLVSGEGFGREGALRHEAWSSSEPTHAVGVSYEKLADGPRSARIVLGTMTMSGVLDEHGLVRDAKLPIGPTALQLQRVSARGAP